MIILVALYISFAIITMASSLYLQRNEINDGIEFMFLFMVSIVISIVWPLVWLGFAIWQLMKDKDDNSL